MQTNTRRLMCAAAALFLVAPAAYAVIIRLYPLREAVNDSQYIVVAKVKDMYPDKPAMVVEVEEDLKGKFPFRKLPMLLKGDKEAEELKHVPQLLKRLAPNLPIILFVHDKMDKKESMIAFAYTNGTWIQFIGDRTGADSAVWSLTHGEPYLRRTYKGTTEELKKTLVDALAGRKTYPPIDKKEPPGFGPEVK